MNEEVDTAWLQEWSDGEAEYPPKTLREDVGALLARIAELEAVAGHAPERQGDEPHQQYRQWFRDETAATREHEVQEAIRFAWRDDAGTDQCRGARSIAAHPRGGR